MAIEIQNLENKLKELIALMGFEDFSINFNGENKRFLIFIEYNHPYFEATLPSFVGHLDHLVKLMARDIEEPIFIDVNNYRLKREQLIIELARAAVRKAIATKQDVSLPLMNAYERRLIHLELAGRPDAVTESSGEGRDRYVVIKPIIDSQNQLLQGV